MNFATAEESLGYLYNLIPRGIKFGLKNISNVLKELGDPQLKIPSIQIAGTNGKGSTAAFCESILRTAGYRVGLYTSPHLIHFSERIQVNRVPLPENEMIDLINRVRKVVETKRIPITFFEFGTAMSFLYFAEHKTDINVVEVGMGGRLDATSLCAGDISIITSISHDHISYLGNKIEEIAYEKASIIKEGGTVFALNENDKVVDVVKRVAKQKSANLYLLGDRFWINKKERKTLFQSITYGQNKRLYENLELSLIGDFQAENAALAVSACLHHAFETKKELREQSIRIGLKTTIWEGRMEVVSKNPTLLLDSAHNPAAVKKLAESVQKLFSYAKVIIIIGLMKDKQSKEILKILSNFGDRFILVRPNQDRSENPQRLQEILNQYKVPCEVIETIPNAIQRVKQFVQPDDMVCITGSIFTVGETKRYLKNEPDCKTIFSPPTGTHLNR